MTITPTPAPATRRAPRAAYGWLLLGGLLPLAAVPDWRLEAGLSVLVIAAVSLLTGRTLAASISGVLAAVTIVLLRTDPADLPLGYRLVGLASAGICTVPILTWRRQRRTFPVLGVFGVIQGVYIYVGDLVARPGPGFQQTYSVPIRELGITTTLLYVVVLVGAGLLVRRRCGIVAAAQRLTSRSRICRSPGPTFVRASVLFVVGLAAVRLLPASVSASLGAIPSIIGDARIAAAALGVALWVRRQLTPLQKVALLAGIAVDVLAGTNGQFALYDAATAAIAAMIALAVLRLRLAAWLLVPLVPLLIVFNVAKTEARAEPTRPASVLSASRRLTTLAVHAVTRPTPEELTTSADRFDYSELLGYVAAHVPSDYPYWNKECYTDLPLLLVPRVVAPFKPKISLYNQFGREYGLIAPNDFGTAVDTPLQVEAFANFGIEGLVIIGAVLGSLLGLADGLFDASTLDGLVLGTLLSFQVVTGIESGITGWGLAIPIVLIFIPLTHWILGVGRRDG